MNTKGTAIITGVTGQMGSYFAEFLLEKGFTVVGGVRRLSVPNTKNIEAIKNHKNLILETMDLGDSHSINTIVQKYKPDYFINCAANSFVGTSWTCPEQHFEFNTLGVLRQLEAIKNYSKHTRYVNFGCHDIQTKILTQEGFKHYTEVKIGELVYSINIKTKNLELKPITQIFEYDYNGKLIQFGKNRLAVTPNHKMIYEENGELKITSAEEFKNINNCCFPHNNPIEGKILPQYIDLSQDIPNNINTKSKLYGTHIDKIDSFDLCYLIGLYIGDGSCRILEKTAKIACSFEDRIKNNRGEDGRFTKNKENAELFETTYYCPQIVLDIPKEDECFLNVVETLDRNKIKWRLHSQCDITFHQWGLIKYFKECGCSSETKHIPSWIFELHYTYQKQVLKGIMDSDGDKTGRIYTASKRLQSDLVKLLLNCGITPTLYERPPRTSQLKNGRQIKQNFPEYSVYCLQKPIKHKKEHIKEINYNNKVWCLEVKDNHNFVVLRNNKITFSGNSSEEFGKVKYTPQDENCPPHARSPYGASKVAAREIVRVYRESYNLYAIQCWNFNYESVRRGIEFYTKRVTTSVARICKEIKTNQPVKPIELGNLSAQRDWSHCLDFVDGVWRQLNQEDYNDNLKDKTEIELVKNIKEYVLSSGSTHTCRKFLALAFEFSNIRRYFPNSKLYFIDEGTLQEKYILETQEGKKIILALVDPNLFRPAEVDILLGDSSLIRNELKWQPQHSFESLVNEMVSHDLREIGIL